MRYTLPKIASLLLFIALPTWAVAQDAPPELDVVEDTTLEIVLDDPLAPQAFEPYYDQSWNLAPEHACGLQVRGWVNGGFMANADSPTSGYNGPYNTIDRSNEGNLNQLYLLAERDLPECGWGVGGRADLMYGQDFFLAQSKGLELNQDGSTDWNTGSYGIALPQAYASIGNQNLSALVGHFDSLMGYETIAAEDNFFYSKSYHYQFARPNGHWGGLVNWSPYCGLSLQAGLQMGWNALDAEQDEVGFIGKVRYDHCSGIWTSFAMITGDEFNNEAQDAAVTDDFTARTNFSWLVGVPVCCQLDYVAHAFYGVQDDIAAAGGEANWYGIDHYLYYTVNDCWKVGARVEWFNDADGTRVGLNRANNATVPPLAGDFYSATVGINWSPNANITIRPEARYDWQQDNAAALAYDDRNSDEQFTYGIDAIIKF